MHTEVCDNCHHEFCPECGATLPLLTFAEYFAPDAVPGCECETPWLICGMLSLASGLLAAGDPLDLLKGTAAVVELPPGEYLIAVTLLDPEDDAALTRVRVVSDPDGVRGEPIAEVFVDMGQFGVRDHTRHKAPSVVVPTGYGDDGPYLIHEVVKGADRVGIEVEFLDTDWEE